MANRIVVGWEINIWLDKTSLATLTEISEDIATLLIEKYGEDVGESFISVGPAEFDEEELLGTMPDEV